MSDNLASLAKVSISRWRSREDNGLLRFEPASIGRNRDLVAARLARGHLECDDAKTANPLTELPGRLWRSLVF